MNQSSIASVLGVTRENLPRRGGFVLRLCHQVEHGANAAASALSGPTPLRAIPHLVDCEVGLKGLYACVVDPLRPPGEALSFCFLDGLSLVDFARKSRAPYPMTQLIERLDPVLQKTVLEIAELAYTPEPRSAWEMLAATLS